MSQLSLPPTLSLFLFPSELPPPPPPPTFHSPPASASALPASPSASDSPIYCLPYTGPRVHSRGVGRAAPPPGCHSTPASDYKWPLGED